MYKYHYVKYIPIKLKVPLTYENIIFHKNRGFEIKYSKIYGLNDKWLKFTPIRFYFKNLNIIEKKNYKTFDEVLIDFPELILL